MTRINTESFNNIFKTNIQDKEYSNESIIKIKQLIKDHKINKDNEFILKKEISNVFEIPILKTSLAFKSADIHEKLLDILEKNNIITPDPIPPNLELNKQDSIHSKSQDKRSLQNSSSKEVIEEKQNFLSNEDIDNEDQMNPQKSNEPLQNKAMNFEDKSIKNPSSNSDKEVKSHVSQSEDEISYQTLINSNEISDKEKSTLESLKNQFNIPTNSLVKIYDDKFVPLAQRSKLLNTLNFIVQKEDLRGEGRIRKSYGRKDMGKDIFGWSITKNGEIFIRMNFKGEGLYMKASTTLCLNDMKYYINLAPRKGRVSNQPGIPKSQIDRKLKDEVFDKTKFQIHNEVKINEAKRKKMLHELNIPHIVPMHLVSNKSETKNVGQKKSYIVEKSEDLYEAKLKPLFTDFVNNKPLHGLPIKEFNFIIEQSFDTLKHLHSHGLSHNDIKPENFLMNSEGGVNLADFDGLTVGDGTNLVPVSTPRYWSPELHEAEENRGLKIATTKNDAYAMGIIYLELLLGSSDPINIFLNNNTNISVKWRNNFYNDDIARIDSKGFYPHVKTQLKNEVIESYKNNTFDASLGNKLRDPARWEEFMLDLQKELMDRGELNDVQQMIAFGIISGLLNPDPDARMTMEEAYEEHINFIESSNNTI